MRTKFDVIAVLGVTVFYHGAAVSAALSASVTDSTGRPLDNTAVYLEPVAKRAFPKPQQQVEVEQKARQFMPLVTVIQTGTSVLFPNNDKVRHHVYSFSPAKTFELKLYSGVPGSPIEFDKAGTVVIGCNIHDKMVGYLHVVDTPLFGKTDAAGKVRVDGLSPGKYLLKAWHPQQPASGKGFEQEVDIGAADVDRAIRMNFAAEASSP